MAEIKLKITEFNANLLEYLNSNKNCKDTIKQK